MTFTACSNDDDDEPSTSNDKIVGTWELVSDTGWEKEDGKIVDEWEDDYYELVLAFDDDGTFTVFEGGNVEIGRWTKKGDKLTIIDSYGDKETMTVKKLNNKTLVLEQSGKETEDGVKYEWWSEITFSRQ